MIYQSFVFHHYNFNPDRKTLKFTYSFDEKIFFRETLIFDFPWTYNLNISMLEKSFFALFVISGISYFKAYLPSLIIFKNPNHYLTIPEQQFFTKTYTKGLGEFFYTNQISPEGKINFPFQSNNDKKPTYNSNLKGNLVALGGGKDSLTTIELLQQQKINFETLTINTTPAFCPLIEEINTKHYNIKRYIAPRLLTLNQQSNTLNGHVPISAIWAFIMVTTSILTGKKNIILSNEHSANHGSTTYKGLKINHQYSKSLEFEQDFKSYLNNFISPDICYFSLLRPYSELYIVEKFCQLNANNKYKNLFSSCNRNFHLSSKTKNLKISSNNHDFFWCGQCPKCVFIFGLFTAFLSRKEVFAIFHGKNLFSNTSLENIFFELLGTQGIKPLECVGEPQEFREALFMAIPNFPEAKKFLNGLSRPIYDLKKTFKHLIPTEFQDIQTKK